MSSSLQVPQVRLQKSFEARVPGSKSLTNRALIAAAMCAEPVVLTGALSSEDTEVASEALRHLGVSIALDGSTWTINGASFGLMAEGVSADSALAEGVSADTPLAERASIDAPSFYLANAGTAVRFMSAILCARGLACRVHGTKRMHERPIELMLQGLRDLGGDIDAELGNGCPPLKIGSKGLEGGSTTLSGQVSSQFFSGLMMAAPFSKRDVVLKVSDEWLSLPYIEMTAVMLKDFGIEANIDVNAGQIVMPGSQTYRSPGRYDIEPDATAATYPMGLAVLHGVGLRLKGLDRSALQGDVKFVDALEKMGCEVREDGGDFLIDRQGELLAIDADLNEIPDAAMTAVVLCAVAKGHSSLRGLKNLAFKECDRLTALATELNKLGCRVSVNEDGFEIDGVELSSLHGAEIETYHDHRMAMCLSLLGTLVPDVVILDPSCVEKTYPKYWEDLQTWCALGSAD